MSGRGIDTSTPPYVFMAWYLVKHRDELNFTYHRDQEFDEAFSFMF
jgi:hypothetical protein